MKNVFILYASGLILLSCCANPPEIAEQSRGIFETVALHTRYKMKISNNCSAGAALVMREGALVYEEYFGTLDKSPESAPVTAESRFPLYSISKEFGVAVLLSLVSEGVLSLDDPAVKYFDYFKGPGSGKFSRDKVTLRHLASHTSGVTRKERRAGDTYQDFSDVTLEFEPGTGFHYNELGMRMLGRIMEKAGGKPYENLLQERVLEPLGLESIGYLRPGDDLTDIVRTFDGLDSTFISYSPAPYPGSGLFGTMRDIARFGQCWMDSGRVGDKIIFNADLVKEAWTNYNRSGRPTQDTEYGLMFWLSSEEKAAFMAGAAQSVAAILPEKKMIVLVGLNQYDGSPGWGRPPVEHSNVARLGLYLAGLMEK